MCSCVVQDRYFKLPCKPVCSSVLLYVLYQNIDLVVWWGGGGGGHIYIMIIVCSLEVGTEVHGD